MNNKEDLIQMIRESSKVTSYTVEWFSEKFKPTDQEIEKSLGSAELTVRLIKELQGVRDADRKLAGKA